MIPVVLALAADEVGDRVLAAEEGEGRRRCQNGEVLGLAEVAVVPDGLGVLHAVEDAGLCPHLEDGTVVAADGGEVLDDERAEEDGGAVTQILRIGGQLQTARPTSFGGGKVSLLSVLLPYLETLSISLERMGCCCCCCCWSAAGCCPASAACSSSAACPSSADPRIQRSADASGKSEIFAASAGLSDLDP